MEIKKFRTDAPAIGPIGLVRPSNAGVRAAESQMRMGQQLLDSAFKLAVDRQEKEGKEFAASYTFARNPDGSLNVEDYSAIIDEADLSKVARASAKPLLNQRYLNATKVDISNAANSFRYNKNADGNPDFSSPANEDQFISNFQSYIAETAKLSGDLGGAVSDLGAAVQVQHVQDIRNKAVKAALDTDKENMLTIIKKTNDDILAMAVGGATVGELTFDEDSEEVGVTGAVLTQLYEQQLANIDQLQAKHSSRIGDDVVPNLKKQLRKSFFGGQANGMAVRVMNQMGGGSSFDSYSRSQFMLNRMSMVMTNPSLYNSLSVEERSIFDAAGFTQKFVTSDEFIGIRDEVASKITVLEGKVAQEFNTTKIAKQNARTGALLLSNQPVSASEAKQFLESQGINNAFDVMRAYSAGSFDEGTPLHSLINGRSALPQQITNMFSPDILADLASQNQLGNAMNMYFTLTRDFDDFGTEIRLNRGFNDETVALMESLGRYSTSMQPEKLSQWFQKTQDFELLDVTQRNSRIKAELVKTGNKTEETVEGFISSVMGKSISAEEANFFRPLAEKYIYFYGADAAREILEQSKNTVFTATKYFRPVEMGVQPKTRFAPEAIMGREELNEFDSAVDSVLRTLTGGANNFLGQTHYLAPTRQRGTYLIVDKESGLMAIDSLGQPVYINANAILKARGMRLRQGARAMELEQERIREFRLTDEEIARQARKAF